MRNNIFRYATKELSQDAFLCWLANWYNYDSPLKSLSKEFVDLIMSRAGVPDSELKSISVLRQYNHIDVLLIINESTGIVIEDKTFSTFTAKLTWLSVLAVMWVDWIKKLLARPRISFQKR